MSKSLHYLPRMLPGLFARTCRLRWFLLTGAAGLALALAVSTLWAGPANAAQAHGRLASVGCYAGGCYNRDPQQMGCAADARTASRSFYWSTSQGKWMSIYLKYSPACDANWAKIEPAPAGWQFYVQDGWGNKVPETVGYNASSWYGNMVDGSRTSWACFTNGVCASG